MRVLMLTRYGRQAASSRLRSLQYLDFLEKSNIFCEVFPLFEDKLLLGKYKTGGYGIFSLLAAYFTRARQIFRWREFDIVWIEKEAFPWLPYALEKALLQKASYVLDYDDAVFHKYDLHRLSLVRLMLGKKLDSLMKNARLVIGGTGYLTNRAKHAGAENTAILPTVVDVSRYQVKLNCVGDDEVLKIVWIGSPSTVKYLDIVEKPLQQLAKLFNFEFRVIGGVWSASGINVTCVPWTEESEAEEISSCDIGVMPLVNGAWEHGKCGYKLIQYMASGLPVVASAVGANLEIVENEVNGFVVESDGDWVKALSKLLKSSALRKSMGASGRGRVELQYSLEFAGPRLVELLRIAGKGV